MAADRGRVRVNGAELSWRAEGEGSEVVLVHAGVADMRMWDAVASVLAGRHRVIRYDMRGWGDTDPRPGRYSHVEDLDGLLDELARGPVSLAGCSLGARVALELAVVSPERVSALLLLSPVLRGHFWSPESRQFFTEEDDALERGDLDEAVRLNVDRWASGLRPEQQALVADMQRRAFELEMGIESEEDVLEPPASGRLGELRLPTLIAVGERDFGDFHAIGDRLARGIPHARRAMVPGAGHLIPLERPRETAGLLQELANAQVA